MGDVIKGSFSRPDRPDREQADADASKMRQQQAGDLRVLVGNNLKMSEESRIIVAEGIYRIIERIKLQNHTVKNLLDEAISLSSEYTINVNFSPKHIGQFSINPDIAKRNDSHIKKLAMKPKPYCAIAQAAAQLLGLEWEEILIEVFGSAKLARSDRPAREIAPEYGQLAKRLCDIADAVGAKYDLQKYFKSVAKSHAALCVASHCKDEATNKLKPNEIDMEWFDGGDIVHWPVRFDVPSPDWINNECNERLPQYPAILLNRWPIGDAATVSIFNDDEQENEKIPSLLGTVKGEYIAELRLCIVPAGPDMRPAAALRVKIFLELGNLSSPKKGSAKNVPDAVPDLIRFPNPIAYAPYGETVGIQGTVTSNDQNTEIYLKCKCDRKTISELILRYFNFEKWSHWGLNSCQFFQINDAICHDWLGISAVWCELANSHEDLEIRVLFPPLFDGSAFDGLSDLPFESVAAGLDCCLSGQGPKIDALFCNWADRYVDAFFDFEEQEIASRQAGYDALDARLLALRGSDK